MQTYSVYSINIENQLTFPAGQTSGYVLAINNNGSTSFVPQTGGGGGTTSNQNLNQVLSNGNTSSVSIELIDNNGNPSLQLNPGNLNTVGPDLSGVGFYTDISQNVVFGFNALGGEVDIQFPTQSTGTFIQQVQPKDGTIALLSDVNVGGNDGANSLRWVFGSTVSGHFNAVNIGATSIEAFINISNIDTYGNDRTSWHNTVINYSNLNNVNSVIVQITEEGNSSISGVYYLHGGGVSASTTVYVLNPISNMSTINTGHTYSISWVLNGLNQGGTGSQGNQGTQGVQGVTGPQGFQGTQGNQGPQGFQGVKGATGPQGFQGFQGNQGTQGFQGVTGPQGFQGTQGNQGATGPQGFQGTQGFQGPTGPQGFQGTQGFQGPTGPQGFQGTQGFQGPTGPQGFQGVTGPQGFQGTQGNQGATGPQGFQGVTGSQGFQGPTGPQGFQGTQGPDVIYTVANAAQKNTITTANPVIATASGLWFTMSANTTWTFQAIWTGQCVGFTASTNGTFYSLIAPVGATAEAWINSFTGPAITGSPINLRITTINTLTTTPLHTTFSLPISVHMSGVVQTGAIGGTVGVGFASVVSGQTSSVLAIGNMLAYLTNRTT